jgi:hypothetical protein
LGQFQEPNALFVVAFVRILVGFDVTHDAALLGSELGRLAVEKVFVDATIQLVHVHRVDSILNAGESVFRSPDEEPPRH